MANNESTDVIREKVDSFEYKPQISSFGHVLKVGDGIFWADGLEGLQLSELVELPGEILRHGTVVGRKLQRHCTAQW